MKKIITASLVAMMAVTAANAEIASVEYVGNTANLDTTAKDDFTVAINELVGDITDINAELGTMATSETVTGLTTRIGTAETEIDALQTADGTIRSEFASADATTLQSAKDYADGLDAAQKTALEQGLATKQDTIDDLAAIRSGATAGATALQSAKDYADGLDAAQKTAFETADSAINDKIGTVAEGKTVVQMIEEAQSTATYDDAELRGLITGNANAISDMDAAYKAADTQVLTDAKAYADGLATNYDAVGSAAAAEAAAIAAAAADATTKADAALAAAKSDAEKYIDANELSASQTAQDTELKNYADQAEADAISTAAADATTKADAALAAAKKYADDNDADTIYDDTLVKADIAAAVKKEQVGIGDGFAISDECKSADAVCSLVVRAGVAGWEKIRY